MVPHAWRRKSGTTIRQILPVTRRSGRAGDRGAADADARPEVPPDRSPAKFSRTSDETTVDGRCARTTVEEQRASCHQLTVICCQTVGAHAPHIGHGPMALQTVSPAADVSSRDDLRMNA